MKNNKREIYAFDFDGTIVTNEFPKIGKPINEVIYLIHKVKKQGHYIILYTMRENEYLEEALEFCKNQGIFFNAINDNVPHMKEFYNNNPRKIFANYYIDDHNYFIHSINLEGTLKRCNTCKDFMWCDGPYKDCYDPSMHKVLWYRFKYWLLGI